MTPTPTVHVTRQVPQAAIERLREHFEVTVGPTEPPTREGLLEAVAEAQGILALLTEPIDASLLDPARTPRLRMVANMAVGYDNIDVEAATMRGVLVTNTPGVLTDATADLTLALLLAVSRRVAEGERFLRAGRYQAWGPLLLLGQELRGRTLGIVGMGRIGQAVAGRAHLGFGLGIRYFSRSRVPEVEQQLGAEWEPDADRLFQEADIVSLHLPLTEQTRHFVDAGRLARMKPTAILLNTARGPIVDEGALATALREGRLFGAGLDVFEEEPAVHPDLMGLDNVTLLPHIGSATIETRTRMAVLAAENLIAGLNSRRPPALVNPAAWDGD